jgi:hypothetical protein
MTATASTPNPPTDTPVPPANPAKGNLRGQTTLAAEIDRWQALASNLASRIRDLFSRRSLALQSTYGPTSPRLKEFGMKPRRQVGRPGKGTTPPPTVEVATTHPSATA